MSFGQFNFSEQLELTIYHHTETFDQRFFHGVSHKKMPVSYAPSTSNPFGSPNNSYLYDEFIEAADLTPQEQHFENMKTFLNDFQLLSYNMQENYHDEVISQVLESFDQNQLGSASGMPAVGSIGRF